MSWSTNLIRTTGALVSGSFDVAERLVLAGAEFGATGSTSFGASVSPASMLRHGTRLERTDQRS